MTRRCDAGYTGDHCDLVTSNLPDVLLDPLDTSDSVSARFEVLKGGNLSFDCGVVASGKAIVFKSDGLRMLQTVNMNTTLVWLEN